MFEAVGAFRKKLSDGQVCVGCGITFTDPSVIEALGPRPDFYWIDLEHTPLDFQGLLAHLIAVRTTGRPGLVRVRGSDVPCIKPVLDTGADGVIVPQVGSADEVRRVVEATRYTPLGKRGLGPRRAAQYGNEDEVEYVRRANQELFISVQIENVDALAEVDEIVAVEGIDSIVIGPADLANSMGYLGQLDHPDVVAAFGTVIENMVFDEETKELDFEDDSLTANMRCAYPLNYISNASSTGLGGHPKNVIMLTCDAFGVLPPIARLTPDQAMYHFLSGYTAKVAGTEIGVTEPEATFSTCFGAPFMPRHPSVYGNLLKERIAKGEVACWLVNTGWTGGKYGTGNRMPIKATRALLNAALDGSLNNAEFRKDPNFGFDVPVSVDGVEDAILDPRSTWADKDEYDRTAAKLVQLFVDNFEPFAAHVDQGVRDAAPTTAVAA